MPQSDDHQPPLEIQEAWHFEPGQIYLVTVNRKHLTPDEAANIKDAFAAHGIRVIIAPAGLLTIREQDT